MTDETRYCGGEGGAACRNRGVYAVLVGSSGTPSYFCFHHAKRIAELWGMRFGWLYHNGEVTKELFDQEGGMYWSTAKVGLIDSTNPMTQVFWNQTEAQLYASKMHGTLRRAWYIMRDGQIEQATFIFREQDGYWYNEKYGAVRPDDLALFVTFKEALAHAISYHMARIAFHQREEQHLRALYANLPPE